MYKEIVRFIAAIILTAMLAIGCSRGIGASSAGPKAGQSAISLQLSGGNLIDTLEFGGTVDKTMSIFSASMKFQGGGLDFTASNGAAVLEQMIFKRNSSAEGTCPMKDVDSNRVFRFPTEHLDHALQPRERSGTVKVERLDGARAHPPRFRCLVDQYPGQ